PICSIGGMSPQHRNVAIYARLSLSTEESVSIARQVEACRRYADARGWRVVAVETDDGVSATSKPPSARPGWRRIADRAAQLDAVVVWKIDRLARRVLDFLEADRALQAHGAGIVAVEDPIDMTTPTGRAFAVMLSVFAELEASNTAARVRAARAHIVASTPGRHPAGRKPWPYRTVDRDDGPGKRLEPIPERAEAVLEAYRRVLAGGSLNGIATDWTERGLLPDPLRSGRQPAWSVASIRRVLTNEALYGAQRHHGELVRNADGTVRIDPHRVIVSRAEWVRVNDLLNRPD